MSTRNDKYVTFISWNLLWFLTNEIDCFFETAFDHIFFEEAQVFVKRLFKRIKYNHILFLSVVIDRLKKFNGNFD